MKFLITMGLGIGMAISAHATGQLITEEISDTQLAQITSQLEKSINNESFESVTIHVSSRSFKNTPSATMPTENCVAFTTFLL